MTTTAPSQHPLGLARSLAGPASAFRAWMEGHALPFWAGPGFEGGGRGFREQLTLDGLDNGVTFKRIRAQARQVYVYSHAAVLGWTGGLDQATEAFQFLRQYAGRPDGAWVRRLSRDGQVLDASVDLYDNAFMLFAIAWYLRATGDRSVLPLAERTVAWIEAHMVMGTTPGFANEMPMPDAPRQQNPHMHLLEAALALAEASQDQRYADLAGCLVRLFREQLFDQKQGVLPEFFGPNWERIPDHPQGRQVEPGHHMEWVWLLLQSRKVTGIDASDEAKALYSFARRFGFNEQTGLAIDAVRDDGQILSADSRLWPQTEALKAELAMAEHMGLEVGPNVGVIVDNLLLRYFAWAPRGTWMDHFTAEGQPRATHIPPSSLYHIFLAYSELLRLEAPAER